MKLRWVLLACILIGLVLNAADDLGAWGRSLVQTSRQGPVDCRQPSEHEQLHIILGWREGKLGVTGCLYAGSRGTYKPGRPATKAAAL